MLNGPGQMTLSAADQGRQEFDLDVSRMAEGWRSSMADPDRHAICKDNYDVLTGAEWRSCMTR